MNGPLVVGDVYRRDAVDSSHYPVFHQMEGVRLFEPNKFFDMVKGPKTHLQLFEKDGVRTDGKQETHTIDSVIVLEHDLKDCLLGLAKHLFGPGNSILKLCCKCFGSLTCFYVLDYPIFFK